MTTPDKVLCDLQLIPSIGFVIRGTPLSFINVSVMINAVIGKCQVCGAKNEWDDRECHGCHMQLLPARAVVIRWVMAILIMLAFLSLFVE